MKIELTKKEILYLLGLLEAQISIYDFIRGFNTTKNEEQLRVEKLRDKLEKKIRH